MKRIFVIMPIVPELEHVYSVIQGAVLEAQGHLDVQIETIRADKVFHPSETVLEGIFSNIDSSDLIIVDLSYTNPNVLYELGFAHGRNKPVILIGQDSNINMFDVSLINTVIYELSRIETSFKQRLIKHIINAIQKPVEFSHPFYRNETMRNNKPTVFVSYSHADAASLSRIMVHLRPLEKENLIELWADTRINAGAKWKDEIEAALDRSAIAVLLISADFLASDFIVDNELPPLLKAAEEKGTTILPVILKPCRFLRDKNLSIFQAINDPKNPLISQTEARQEEIYSMLADRIENELITGA